MAYLLLAYILYRGIIDAIRFKEIGIFQKMEILKALNPLVTIKYFRKLYLQ